MSQSMYFGAIEAGGTKFNCAFGKSHSEILESVSLKTRDPKTTLAEVFHFFDGCGATQGHLQSMGVVCFGPVDLAENSPTYGHIIETPKPGWAYTDIVGAFQARYAVPVGFDTDVNGAAIGEWIHGVGRRVRDIAYVTVGTGIGVGAIINGRPLHGLVHAEFGHIEVLRREGEAAGICPSHSSCLEGFASGPALAARWGCPAERLPADHIAWESEADYLARLCVALTLGYSPTKIVMGGGIMKAPGLLDRIRENFVQQLNGYLPTLERAGGVERYIVRPGLGDLSGIAGAFELAKWQLGAGFSIDH